MLPTPAPGPNRQWRSAIRYLIISCAQCQEEFKTDRKRKYCAPKCREKANKAKRPDRHKRDPWHEKTCLYCLNAFTTQDNRSRYCTQSCHLRHVHGWSQSKELLPYDDRLAGDMLALQHLIAATAEVLAEKRRKDLRSPLRKAYEEGDMPGVIHAIKADSKITERGCWEWQRQVSREGYGRVKFGSKGHFVHRLSAMAQHGQPESEPVVHHVCANRLCVNPEHLQPVSQRENTAEMLERNYYRARIAELEAALSHVDPNNSALKGYTLTA